MSKIAFIFLTLSALYHQDIWHTFFAGNEKYCSVYLHPQTVKTNSDKLLESRLQAEISLLNQALKDPANEKFIFLLESSFPEVSFKEVYTSLTKHPLCVFDYMPTPRNAPHSFKQHWLVLNRKYAEQLVSNEYFVSDLMLNEGETHNSALYLLSLLRKGVRSMQSASSTMQTSGQVLSDPAFSIEFERAMGKFDEYSSPYFELCFDKKAWQYMDHKYDPKKVFTLSKNCYEKYCKVPLISTKKSKKNRTIHQIWIGKKPFPPKYKKWQKTWQSLPGWNYKLWTDNEVKDFPLINRKLYEQEPNYGARADILRLEILNKEGGLYVDTDFECIRPDALTLVHDNFDFYVCLHPLDCEAILINNAIIGSVPNHPILQACIEQLKYQSPSNNSFEKIVRQGPGLLSQMTLKHMNTGYKDIIFPASVFYPLGVFELKRPPLSSLSTPNDEKFDIVKALTIKPETIAFHWWEGNWTHP